MLTSIGSHLGHSFSWDKMPFSMFKSFSGFYGFTPQIYRREANTLYLLNTNSLPRPADSDLAFIFQYKKNAIGYWGDHLHGDCHLIASDFKNKIDSSFTLSSENASLSLTGFQNHSISGHKLSDGSFLAIDYTAGCYMDHNTGNFDILAIRTDSLENLKKSVKNLYGGDWEIES